MHSYKELEERFGLSPNSDHIMICGECVKKEFPEGHETITLGLLAPRKCVLCSRVVTNKDSYSWITKLEFVEIYSSRYPLEAGLMTIIADAAIAAHEEKKKNEETS